MLTRILREFLYNLVHWVISLIILIQIIYRQYYSAKCDNKDEIDHEDIKLILEQKQHLTKKLEHVVVITDWEFLNFQDLAKVVIWSLVCGIPYVSFYDAGGKLKKSEEKFFHEVEKKKKGVPGCIKWLNKPDLNGYSNGVQAYTVYVNIFTKNDGRAKIAHCIQRIAKKEIICDDIKEMTAQALDKALSLDYKFIPDPNLALYLGPCCCTKGLLPWQIRLTEFIQLSVDNDLSLDKYLDALQKYNKCDQRFGK